MQPFQTIGNLVKPACHTRSSIIFLDRRTLVDREFGEDYRDAHFPPGWFVLPLVGAGALVAALVGFVL
jgi:hypothetical protein